MGTVTSIYAKVLLYLGFHNTGQAYNLSGLSVCHLYILCSIVMLSAVNCIHRSDRWVPLVP